MGRPDATLTLDLGRPRVVSALAFAWEHGATKVLALASTAASGDDDWVKVGAADGATPPARLTLSFGDANADGVADLNAVRRIRLHLGGAADTSASGLPLFGIRDITAEGCAPPTANATAASPVAYNLAATPLVRSVTPSRGSTAGGTTVRLAVRASRRRDDGRRR